MLWQLFAAYRKDLTWTKEFELAAGEQHVDKSSNTTCFFLQKRVRVHERVQHSWLGGLPRS